MQLLRITDVRGRNISLRIKDTPISKLIYDTFPPAETYVDQGKDEGSPTLIKKDGAWNGLHTVALALIKSWRAISTFIMINDGKFPSEGVGKMRVQSGKAALKTARRTR